MDKDMSEIKIPKILLSQVEDALEERENNDRRKKEKGIPTGLQAERRKQDRRAAKNQGWWIKKGGLLLSPLFIAARIN